VIAATRVHGLSVAALDTSCRLVQPDAAGREATFREARFMIDLALELAAPAVRVFGGELSGDMTVEEALPPAAELLGRMADEAAARGLVVLVETHDPVWSRSRNVTALTAACGSPGTGVLYDVLHPCRAGESLGETLAVLGARVRLVHLKDARRPPSGSDRWGLCMIGEGDVPLPAALVGLRTHGYTGWYSFEWEKRWHPELEEPEIALPAANKAIRDLLSHEEVQEYADE
jgi:sugar phosphate isomerase/epimerase